jgi:hypothetical protein
MAVASQLETAETASYSESNESAAGAREPRHRIDRELRNVDVPQPVENCVTPTIAHEGRQIVTFPNLVQHPPAFRFTPLKRWEGTVVKVTPNEDEFTARLRNLDNPKDEELQAVISLAEVTDSDRPLVQEGAVFYWNIGYLTDKYGTKSSIGTIRFRRLPVWTTSEIARIQEFASEYNALLREHS